MGPVFPERQKRKNKTGPAAGACAGREPAGRIHVSVRSDRQEAETEHFGNGGTRMKKEEFMISSRDGKETPVHCVKWIPDGVAAGQSQPATILQIIHGMAEYVERYEPFARWLTERNILVCGEDHLGHGKTAQKPEELGFFCEQDPATVVVRDVHRLKKTVQDQYPGVPYFILGHSMGSFIARNYLFRYGSGIDGAIIMGTGMTPKKVLDVSGSLAAFQEKIYGSHHIARTIDHLAFSSYNKRIPAAETPFDWLSVNRENVSRYIADPLCGYTFTLNGFETMFELIQRLYVRENLDRMPKDLPVLFISGSEDPVGGYGEQVKSVADSFTREEGMTDVMVKLVDGCRHEILNEDNRLETYEYLLDWMKQHASRASQ